MSISSEPLMSMQPGTVIAGRYEVVKSLGAGSMGVVYACRHRELTGHMVAVKVLFPEVANDKVAAARFKNEIFASYSVSHPNVVRAYEYLRDGDLVAYAMEYVAGGALAERLEGASQNPIPIPEVVNILAQMCAGVQAIHDAGIVHRDLKPENILLAKDGQVKIADFGIARMGHGPKLTEHGGVVGTIDYVSPEYMLNAQVDWRSDIYALGILAFEMVTGESPFRGDSVYATMTLRLKSDPPPPSSLRPECSPELDKIILKAMARDPEARYQSAAEIHMDLQKLTPLQGVPSGAQLSMQRKPVPPAPLDPVVEQGAEEKIEKPVVPGGAAIGGRVKVVGKKSEPARNGGYEPAPSSGEKTIAWSFGDTPVDEPRMLSGPQSNVEPVREIGFDQHGGERQAGGKLESVLSYPRGSSPEWKGGQPRKDSNVVVHRSGIDNARIRKLSQLSDQANPSLLVDIVFLVVAALIGIGVGFAALKIFFPDVVGATSETSMTIDSGSNENDTHVSSGKGYV